MAKKQKKPEESSVAKPGFEKLPSSFRLLGDSFKFLSEHIKILSGVTAVYAVLYVVFVRAGSSFDVDGTNEVIRESLGDNDILNNTVLTGTLISSGGSTDSAAGGLYSFVLLIIGALAFIWAIRRLIAGKKFLIRDAYYRGMYPMIPFVIVLFIISLQLLPFVIGGFIYSTAELNGLITTILERVLFIILWGGLSALSAYWLANSLMTIYAVTLPDIYPMQALRSTKQVVQTRRWTVLSRMLMLVIFLAVFAALILLPFVFIAPSVAVYAYDFVAIVGLLFVNIYMFKLYRSLI